MSASGQNEPPNNQPFHTQDRFSHVIERGDAHEIFVIGTLFEHGQKVPQSFDKALYYYQIAADKGSHLAHKAISGMYMKAKGQPQNTQKAIEHLEIAAELGNTDAPFILGYIFEYGEGTDIDMVKAAKWYESAKLGHADSQYFLGTMYQEGRGVKKDYKKASEWFLAGAEQGDIWLQYELGEIFYNGHGVPQDYAESVKWMTRSAEQVLGKAQLKLGFLRTRSCCRARL